jgi:parallel beta-helix repeat protein
MFTQRTDQALPFPPLLAVAMGIVLAVVSGGPSQTVQPTTGTEIRVGVDGGDLRGSDQRTLQAAVDQIAQRGGGTVRIGPGRYTMRNALTLRDHVHIVGEPGKTILVSCDSIETRLALDGDCNERQLTLADASGFRVGDGVVIRDNHFAGGFTVTTATLTGQVDARTFRLSAPLYLDYLVSQGATARLAFPVVGGWNVKDVVVEGLTIDGPGGKAVQLDGCRGSGIYLFECAAVTIRHCIVRGYPGDGISFQVSERVTVEDCLCEANAGLGVHPGSGSQQPVVRRNRSVNNGSDGLYVCWRVKHGLFEDNEITGNKGAGISIGHKDTDNQFRNNVITGNGGPGVLFRNESEPMGAHRNVFARNRILDNGLREGNKESGASIVIHGHHDDLLFRENIIGRSQSSPGGVGILCSKQTRHLQTLENQFLNVQTEIQTNDR